MSHHLIHYKYPILKIVFLQQKKTIGKFLIPESYIILIYLHPQMWNFHIGLNKENKQVYVYYQICPSCKDTIVGIKTPKEGSFICYPNDTEGLILLHEQISLEVYPITDRKSPDKRKVSLSITLYRPLIFRAGEVEERISKEDETDTHSVSLVVVPGIGRGTTANL